MSQTVVDESNQDQKCSCGIPLWKNPLALFCTAHLVFWTLISYTRGSMSVDTIEALIWGRLGLCGSDKHPPLSGWLADWFYTGCGGYDIGIYFLSQLCVVIGFLYINRLARFFLSADKAILAVMLQECILYYTLETVKYNVNVISLALWPATAYYFYLSVTKGTLRNYIFLGVVAALNLLNKYVCVMLFAGMFAYLLMSPLGRRQFVRYGMYLAGILCVLLCLPHLFWLYETDFGFITYVAHQTSGYSEVWYHHITEPLVFFLAQIGYCAPALGYYAVLYFFSARLPRRYDKEQKLFLLCVGVGPLLVMCTYSLLTGARMVNMWGMPMAFLVGTMLFFFLPLHLSERAACWMRKAIYGMMAVCLIVEGIGNLTSGNLTISFPREDYLKMMEADWKKEAGEVPLKYVTGDIWYTSNASLYHAQHPRVVLSVFWKKNPWVTAGELRKSGLMVIGTNNTIAEFEPLLKKEGAIRTLTYRNRFGEKRMTEYWYVVLPPNSPDLELLPVVNPGKTAMPQVSPEKQ